MGDGENLHTGREADCLLAGLEAGIISALVLLAWLSLASAWYSHSIWTAANTMATTFYGEAALGGVFTSRTVAGLALYLILYGIIGALFGLALASRGPGPGLRITMIGVVTGLGWYYLSFALLWRNLNPIITLYTHRGPMIAGHVIYGGLLGRFPNYLPSARHAGEG
ncbi:MAG TPA: hypothetical protein VKR61_25245 [Bryobacteraceae bacterium]|nr:hypothetical protein [Bryobacteraceae bacterium]